MKKNFLLLPILALMTACATAPPQQPDDICKIFEEKPDWYDDAKDAQDKWGSPKHVLMSMMYQESSFKHDATPPMDYFLWVIPIGRVSSAYGYSQAKTPTWSDYMRETGNSGADRDDFDDAIDFMAWFVYKTNKINGVSKWDAYAQYLNYHEGWGGYRRGSYKSKQWLIGVANKVKHRASRYSAQLKRCEKDLNKSWLDKLFF
ncbi:transglycosylase SLT domain-containing protein [Pseudoalteromonas fenneropenaei]|uniref:Transglycosylase SLT domain-containing protein n=1 Tax=Pseudoalteromonas fenneropenaei TaxID=1737459 RepID=A0ABV7CN28_9GAMM